MKNVISDLSLFGGTMTFDQPLHVGRPNVGNREKLSLRINDLLDRKWLSNNGPYVQEFEQKICAYLGVRNCIAMCNATIALEIVIRALGFKGEVIVPSFTFVATAHALQWQEITPVFCDVNPQTHNLDPNVLEKMITPRTSGIIGVHIWGRPCEVEILSDIAQRKNIRIMYDAAHAFGCSHGGTMIGNFGEAEVFSFHATKFLNTFEGGAIVTNNDDLARQIRLMTNFGFDGYDNVIYLGTNGKMSEVSAAMGITGLECIEDIISVNRRNYFWYQKEIEEIPGLRLIHYNEEEKNNFQYIVVEVDENITGISRDFLVKILHAENVLARRYFYPGCHKMEPYRSLFPHAGLLLHETDKLSTRVLVLPTGTSVGLQEIGQICEIIRLCVNRSDEVCDRLRINS